MSEKTRMHEILGVEPGEVFEHVQRGLFYFVDSAGSVKECPDKNTNNWRHKHAEGHVISSMINLPEGIIRKPRLTPQQADKLRALYDFGMRWLFYTNKGANAWLYATEHMPEFAEHLQAYTWHGERIQIKGSVLLDLVNREACKPFDIERTLLDCGLAPFPF